MELSRLYNLEKYYANPLIRQYQAYVLIDIENKLEQLVSSSNDNLFIVDDFSKLIKLKSFYETASVDELIADFINSANARYQEEGMSYAKQAFDLLLSKKKFSSYH